MVTLACWLLILSIAPASPAPVATSEPLVFRIGFWNNLHHFLYVLGRAQNGAPDAKRDAVKGAPGELQALASRPDAERAAWQAAVDFYASSRSKQDAVFDVDTLVKETRVLADAPDSSDLSGLDLDPALVATLRRAAPVYRAVWWPDHRHADDARRRDLEPFVEKYGAALVRRLTAIYHAQWPAQPRMVNLSAYTNWAGAYSTDGGLIVCSSKDPSIAGALGLEILFHESSHQWDEDMQRRLSSAAHGSRVPNTLSHALVFYTSGAIVKELIPGHVPYADQAGIWERGGMRGLKPVLDEYWRPYLEGHGTLDEALAAVVAHVQ